MNLAYQTNIVSYTQSDIGGLSEAIENANKEGKDILYYKGSQHLITYAKWLRHHLIEAFGKNLR